MKKFYLSALLGLATVVGLAQDVKTIEIVKYNGDMNIDGVASEAVWKDSKVVAQPIDVVFEGESDGFVGNNDLAATFKAFYSNDAIVFFVSVTDDIACTAVSRWKGDKIEIYFGLPGYDEFDGACQALGRQFAVMGYDETLIGWGKDGGSGAQCSQYPGADKYETSGVEFFSKETPNGYDVEIKITRLALNDMELKGDVAYDISVNDVDDPDLSDAEQKRYRKSWYNDGSVAENWTKLMGLGKLNFGAYEIPSTPSGTSSLLKNNISVYPNPTSDILSIKGIQAVNIRIYDVNGKEVLSADNVSSVNMKDFGRGIYYAEISTINGECLGVSKVVRR
jgi:hypothetical protein